MENEAVKLWTAQESKKSVSYNHGNSYLFYISANWWLICTISFIFPYNLLMPTRQLGRFRVSPSCLHFSFFLKIIHFRTIHMMHIYTKLVIFHEIELVNTTWRRAQDFWWVRLPAHTDWCVTWSKACWLENIYNQRWHDLESQWSMQVQWQQFQNSRLTHSITFLQNGCASCFTISQPRKWQQQLFSCHLRAILYHDYQIKTVKNIQPTILEFK